MLKPLRDSVLLEADKATERTASGLYIKEDWATLPSYGNVISVGPEVKDIKAGDRVLFNRYAAIQLEEQKRLVTERDIQAIDVAEDV